MEKQQEEKRKMKEDVENKMKVLVPRINLPVNSSALKAEKVTDSNRKALRILRREQKKQIALVQQYTKELEQQRLFYKTMNLKK